MQGMPKSREKSSRETHNMTKIRKKMQCCTNGKESKGLVSKRVTHASRRHIVKSSIDRAVRIRTQE
jgi:hypothetical protein